MCVATPAAEDPRGRGHVQGGGGRHPPAGVRAQSGRAGGSDPGASGRRRHPAQRRPEHDLNLSYPTTCCLGALGQTLPLYLTSSQVP